MLKDESTVCEKCGKLISSLPLSLDIKDYIIGEAFKQTFGVECSECCSDLLIECSAREKETKKEASQINLLILSLVVAFFVALFVFGKTISIILTLGISLLIFLKMPNNWKMDALRINKERISKRKKRIEAEEKKWERFKEEMYKKKETLISSGNYKYISNFIKRFGKTQHDSSVSDRLIDLLKTKGVNLNDDELKFLLDIEIEYQVYEDFKARILSGKPQNVKDCIKSFLDIFDETNQEHIRLLKKMLDEMNVEFDEKGKEEIFEIVRKEKEIEHLERMLESESEFISMEKINSMDGYEFESFLSNLFQKMGYKVEQTKLSGDQGADLIISKFGERTAVQAKRHKNQVSNTAVQEVVASIKYYNCDKGMVATTSLFTASAIELADANNVELIDGEKLESLINKSM